MDEQSKECNNFLFPLAVCFFFRNSLSQLHMHFMRQRVNIASKHLVRIQAMCKISGEYFLVQ